MRWLVPLLLVTLLLTPLPTATAQVPTGPEGVHLAYGADPATSMTVMWTGPPAQTALVEYGVGNLTEQASAEAEPAPGTDRVAYTAHLTSLDPGTTYRYRAVLDEANTTTWSFTTAPGSTNTTVTVGFWADHGWPAASPAARSDGDAPVRNMELARKLDPTFHLVAGDVSYADGDPRIWDTYFAGMEPYAATRPYMTAPGNHEREPGLGYASYDARLKMPEEEDGRWWAMQVGSALFIGLNDNNACVEGAANQAAPTIGWRCGADQEEARVPNGEQIAFLESQLQRAEDDAGIRWTVVVHHMPVWSAASHGSNRDLQALWMPLYDEYGVDLVLNGHDHVYERTHPLVNGSVDPNGTTYIVNGAGGAEFYEFEEDSPAWEAARDGSHHGTLLLSVSPTRLAGGFVRLDGNVSDTFALGNGPGQTTDEGGVPPSGQDEDGRRDGGEEEGLSSPRDGGGGGEVPTGAVPIVAVSTVLGTWLARGIGGTRRREP